VINMQLTGSSTPDASGLADKLPADPRSDPALRPVGYRRGPCPYGRSWPNRRCGAGRPCGSGYLPPSTLSVPRQKAANVVCSQPDRAAPRSGKSTSTCHTIWRVVTGADAAAVDMIIGAWLAGRAAARQTVTRGPDGESPELVAIAVDGKTVRGATDTEGNQVHRSRPRHAPSLHDPRTHVMILKRPCAVSLPRMTNVSNIAKALRPHSWDHSDPSRYS
jgi:hypothetical protein